MYINTTISIYRFTEKSNNHIISPINRYFYKILTMKYIIYRVINN